VTAPELLFAISLKPRQAATDWGVVDRNLERTIASIRASSDPAWRIVVACHEPPDDAGARFPEVTFLRAPYEASANEAVTGAADKHKKRRLIGAWLREHAPAPRYMMPLDADDLVHRDLVRHVRAADNRRGFYVETGYKLDVAHRMLMTQGASPFWWSCGSCIVAYVEPDELPLGYEDTGGFWSALGSHRNCIDNATAHGRPPDRMPWPSMVYVYNHGDNRSSKRLDRPPQRRVRPEFAYAEPEARTILARDFAWRDWPVSPGGR
jgi:hypothetical protein